MISYNLEKRIEHWSDGWTAKNQGDSPPAPFINYVQHYVGANVLEIGPGEGRAHETVRRVVSGYAIADISADVLKAPVWENIKDKVLIRTYEEDFGKQFDVVHFWYVLHHIPRCEVWDFFLFAIRHLKTNGHLMFNTPYLGFAGGAYSDNGVLTTRYSPGEILNLLELHLDCLVLDGTNIGKSNGHIYVGRKR